jgi:hypothetical protein
MANKTGNKGRTSIYFRYNAYELKIMKQMFLEGKSQKDIADKFGCCLVVIPKLRRILGCPKASTNHRRVFYQIIDFVTDEILLERIEGLENLEKVCCRSKGTIAHHICGDAKSTNYKNRKVYIKRIK